MTQNEHNQRKLIIIVFCENNECAWFYEIKWFKNWNYQKYVVLNYSVDTFDPNISDSAFRRFLT